MSSASGGMQRTCHRSGVGAQTLTMCKSDIIMQGKFLYNLFELKIYNLDYFQEFICTVSNLFGSTLRIVSSREIFICLSEVAVLPLVMAAE